MWGKGGGGGGGWMICEDGEDWTGPGKFPGTF